MSINITVIDTVIDDDRDMPSMDPEWCTMDTGVVDPSNFDDFGNMPF